MAARPDVARSGGKAEGGIASAHKTKVQRLRLDDKIHGQVAFSGEALALRGLRLCLEPNPRVRHKLWRLLSNQSAVRRWLNLDPALCLTPHYSLFGKMFEDRPNGRSSRLLRVELPVWPDHAAHLIGRAWCGCIEACQSACYNFRLHLGSPGW